MHDGTNMTIRTGTGSIRIEPKSGELGVLCVPDAETALYYNNEKMFDTLKKVQRDFLTKFRP